MEDATDFMEPRQSHHQTFYLDVTHPVAQFFAAARTALSEALDEIERLNRALDLACKLLAESDETKCPSDSETWRCCSGPDFDCVRCWKDALLKEVEVALADE